MESVAAQGVLKGRVEELQLERARLEERSILATEKAAVLQERVRQLEHDKGALQQQVEQVASACEATQSEAEQYAGQAKTEQEMLQAKLMELQVKADKQAMDAAAATFRHVMALWRGNEVAVAVANWQRASVMHRAAQKGMKAVREELQKRVEEARGEGGELQARLAACQRVMEEQRRAMKASRSPCPDMPLPAALPWCAGPVSCVARRVLVPMRLTITAMSRPHWNGGIAGTAAGCECRAGGRCRAALSHVQCTGPLCRGAVGVC